jgi:hypothetical protein
MALYAYALLAGASKSARLGRGAFREPLQRRRYGAWDIVVGRREHASRPTEAALRAQMAVVRRLSTQAQAILPFRFGSVAKDSQALERSLRARAGELARALRQVSHCVQMTLVLTGRTNPQPVVGASRGGRDYLGARAAHRRWEASAPELDRLRPRLRGMVRAERVARGGDSPGVRVFHLVPEAKRLAYEAVIGAARLPGIHIRTSGPLPPFAFAPEWAP